MTGPKAEPIPKPICYIALALSTSSPFTKLYYSSTREVISSSDLPWCLKSFVHLLLRSLATESIISGATGTKIIDPKKFIKNTPIIINQIVTGSPILRLGPPISSEITKRKRADCITTKREIFSQSQPLINEPKPNAKPTMANTNPTFSSYIPKNVSLTERMGSMYTIQIIATIQSIKAMKALLQRKICLYVTYKSGFDYWSSVCSTTLLTLEGSTRIVAIPIVKI